MATGDETTENVGALSHSEGEADPIRRPPEGSDVGGPAQASESTTEEALTGSSTVGDGGDPESQAVNPS